MQRISFSLLFLSRIIERERGRVLRNEPLFSSMTDEWSQSGRLDFMNIGLTIFIAIISASISTIVLFNLITRSIRTLLENNSQAGPPRSSEAQAVEESDQADKTTQSKKKKRKPKNRRAEVGGDQRVAKADAEEFRIGVIELSSTILGKGSAGTVVFQVGRQWGLRALVSNPTYQFGFFFCFMLV